MDVDKLLALCEAATQWGVLRLCDYGDGTSHNRIFEHLTGRLIADNVDGPDAAFIAAAREHFPEALRRLKRLAELQNKIYYCKVSTIDPMCIALRASLTEAEMKELRELLDLDLPAEGK